MAGPRAGGYTEAMGYQYAVVCESDIVQALAWEHALVQANYIVYGAHDYFRAIQVIGEKRPSLLVIESKLAVGDARPVLKAAREGPHKPYIVAISQDTREAAELLKLGANEVISKPAGREDIQERVGRIARQLPARAPLAGPASPPA